MGDDSVVEINDELRIPRGELTYRASRSGGPGGQHVNKTATRIELWWDVASSPSLSEAQRARLLRRLATRLDGDGRLRIVASEMRSQLRNRVVALERLRDLVDAALRVPKVRRKTKPSRAAKAARVEAKRRHADTKAGRRRVAPEE